MKDLMIFNNPEFGEIRTIEEDGRVLFCGADVAKALGYAKPQNAVATHCRGALKRGILTNGGEQEMSFIPESDLYRLVFGSKLPTAEKFTDWVTGEVLPSIRKHGGYLSGQETMSPEELMAKALKVAEKTLADREARISALTVENAIMAPKADYFDELVDRNLLTNFRETAKQLNVPPKKFVSFLLEKKYIYRDKRRNGFLIRRSGGDYNMPTQRAMELGLFEIKETAITHADGHTSVNKTPKITGKGQQYFVRVFLSREKEANHHAQSGADR